MNNKKVYNAIMKAFAIIVVGMVVVGFIASLIVNYIKGW